MPCTLPASLVKRCLTLSIDDHRAVKDYVDDLDKRVDKKKTKLHPVIEEFRQLIEEDTHLYLLFNCMFACLR